MPTIHHRGRKKSGTLEPDEHNSCAPKTIG